MSSLRLSKDVRPTLGYVSDVDEHSSCRDIIEDSPQCICNFQITFRVYASVGVEIAKYELKSCAMLMSRTPTFSRA